MKKYTTRVPSRYSRNNKAIVDRNWIIIVRIIILIYNLNLWRCELRTPWNVVLSFFPLKKESLCVRARRAGRTIRLYKRYPRDIQLSVKDLRDPGYRVIRHMIDYFHWAANTSARRENRFLAMEIPFVESALPRWRKWPWYMEKCARAPGILIPHDFIPL